MIATEALNIGYGNKVIQANLTLQANEGELTALCGPNGVGKSTLLRSLCGLQPTLNGSVKVNQKPLQQMKDAEKAKTLALVLTDKIMEDRLTVFDLVAMGRVPFLAWHGSLADNDIAKTQQAIEMVGLTHKAEALISAISDGERQRVMIAKALAQETPIILLDEPTSHLDLPSRIEIMLLLKALAHDTNKCIILSTHELDLAIQCADNIWLMDSKGIKTEIPEDLMLSGAMQATFQSDNFLFDSNDGHCVMLHTPNNNYKHIHIEGGQQQAIWLKHALQRTGFVVDDADINTTVKIDNGKFLLPDNTETTRISDVLTWAKQQRNS
ncbi:MAG: ABC transporter ATP-binding protein [Bacteroidales bacterium]|nr:ABC transporter ATP-binding protein [Bacteroidales bacterium]